MKVVFRADASMTLGSGHVMRCLTLASALRARGASVLFVCRESGGDLCNLIEERGFPVSRLSATGGLSWLEDANDTRTAVQMSGDTTEWLVVDHYALDARYERALRTLVSRILVIDDLANRPHDCDVLLDQNLLPFMQTRYTGRVPEAAEMLLGPRYALLQPMYAELRAQIPSRNGPTRNILVWFGGADRSNLTGRAVAALLRLSRGDIDVDVVIAGSLHAEAICRQVGPHRQFQIHSGLPTLAPLMAKADLAVGAGGATSWERVCLALPAIVVTISENQRSVAAELDRLGLIRWIGHQDEVDSADIERALCEAIDSPERSFQKQAFHGVVDGCGAGRVCDRMRS